MKIIKSGLWATLMSVLILSPILSQQSSGVEEDGPMAFQGAAISFNVTQFESDYKSVFSISGLDQNHCSCSNTTQVIGAANSFGSGTNIFSFYTTETSTAIDLNFGPSASRTIYTSIYYTGRRPVITCLTSTGCSSTITGSNAIAAYTSAIYNPTTVSATDAVDDDRVTITWDKGTDLPDIYHGYRIYRDNSLVATVSGSTRSYVNTGLSPGYSGTYRVATYTNSFGSGDHESPGVSDTGSTFSINLQASDGTKYGNTNLSWDDISHIAEDIRVERSIPNSANREELDILNENATSYNDNTGIPGFSYTYYVTPIGGSFFTDTDVGYSRPNGTIKGHVKSLLAAGVSGVEINVEILDNVPVGGNTLPTCPQTYCTTTDVEGYYEIKDIYYYEGAEFIIVPFKAGLTNHEFTPENSTRLLDPNAKVAAGVDFTDLTVFTVGGQVTYPLSSNGVTCGMKGVTILINNENFGIKTDADGEWTFAIQDEDTYSFKPDFLHHTFEDGAGIDSTELFISNDILTLDFENTQTDSLQITAQGGCQASLGAGVEIRVTAPNNCFNETYMTDVNGLLTIYDLPARDYIVEVMDINSMSTNVTNILEQIGTPKKIEVDLTLRDTSELITEVEENIITPEILETLMNGAVIVLQEADTIFAGSLDTMRREVEPNATFIYRSPLDITVDFDNAGATVTGCTSMPDGDPIIVMEQGLAYTLEFEVKELLGIDCYIDTGFLKIYDFVSDREGEAISIPIIGGIATYQVLAGQPNIAENLAFHNHEKLIYVIPEVDLVEPAPLEFWILVTGSKSNTPTFITRTPDIPMIILHDPPGDQSYAYIEKGTTFSNFTTNEIQVGGQAGVYANLLLGAKILTPFSGNGFGAVIKFQAEAGRDNFDRDGIFTNISFTERFTTSDLENITGDAGDVYVGAAYNQEYSLAEQLTFDKDNCMPLVDIVPSLAASTFATTFVYTELHIKNTLLPTFSFLKQNILDGQPFASLSVLDQAEVNNLTTDSLMWVNILDQNELARDEDAGFKENVSFSAGAQLSREFTSDTTTSVSYEYNRFVNSEFALGAKIDNESGVWFDSELGAMGKFRWSTTTNTSDDTLQTRTVGYVFDDNDIGDFFSVDILEDESYNVPAFRLKLGTTSCPQEPGSQARDRATIKILPPEITNVPTDGAANFVCQVTNVSESFETREYGVRVVSTTNPDGAIVRLGGQIINNGGANFFLTHNQTQNLNLSVTRGPVASNYSDIGIMIYPPCEYELWQDNGSLMNSDTAFIKILNFQTQCTDVALSKPNDGWLINQNSPLLFHTTFSGYDLNNEQFESLTLQVKAEGDGYVDQRTIDKIDLTGPNYDLFFDMSSFPDGLYRMRARANCGLGGVTYSSEKLGIIDRSSLAPFGQPTPSDGFLRFGEEISVSFDKEVDCGFDFTYQPVVTLTRDDTGEELAVTSSCFGNKLILNTVPHLTERPELQGVLINARVDSLRDLSGNIQEYSTNWPFLVNVNPVFWDPDHLVEARLEGTAHQIEGVLKNNTLLSKVFSLDLSTDPTIVDYPDWLTPLQTRGTILPNDDFIVEFDVDDSLLPGIYTGTVTAAVDDKAISFDVTFELLAKVVNWPFDPTQFQYSMTVVAQFSLDDTDVLLSDDTRDLVGAFVNGEIRGVANIEYLQDSDSYAAFLTVYSNNENGDNNDITFRFWHALNGVEYGAVETLPFESDDRTGSVSDPFILHPMGIFQIIPLNVGWNWISFNVETDDMSIEDVFQSIMGATAGNDLIVKSQSRTSTYTFDQDSWNGNLDDVDLGDGYLLYLSNNPDTLKIVGLPSPVPISVEVSGDWTWIGFPRLNPESVNDVLSDLTNSQEDQIKDQFRFSQYEEGVSAWEGSLKFLSPGVGYKLSSEEGGDIEYLASRDLEYHVTPFKYEYNMNITGTFDPAFIGEKEMDDLTVGAFIDDEVRGVGKMEYVPEIGKYRVFMLALGNRADYNKPIQFKIRNDNSEDEYLGNGDQLTFGADVIVGHLQDPYKILDRSKTKIANSDGYALMQNKPNPASNSTLISFEIPVEERVVISIFDVDGKVIKEIINQRYLRGNHKVEIDLSDLQKGVYFYEMKTDSYKATRKMLVI